MARLGEAYVRVRADLRDYDADLDRALKDSTDKFEKALDAKLGRKLGKEVGAGLTAEIDDAVKTSAKKLGDTLSDESEKAGKRSGTSFWSSLGGALGKGTSNAFKGIGGLLTDGLSGLPPQLRLIFGTAVVAAAPVIIAGIGGAVSGGVALGVAGLGVALASQYEEVREGAQGLMESIRESLVGSAEPFVAPLLESFGRIDAFFEDIRARMDATFTAASKFITPLTSGVLGLFDRVTRGIAKFTESGDGYIDAIADGMIFLGDAVEDVLGTLGDLGDEGEQALRDVLYAAADIIVFLGDLVYWSTRAYNSFRDLATGTEWWNYAIKVLLPGLALADVAFSDIDEGTAEANAALLTYGRTTGQFADEQGRAIRVTDSYTKAMKEQADAIKDVRDAQFATIDSTVAFRSDLLDLKDAIKENGKELSYQTKGGLDNIAELSRLFQGARRSAQDYYAEGRVNAEQAQQLYQDNIEEIYRTATAWGVSRTEIDKIFGALKGVIDLPPVNDKFSVLTAAAIAAQTAINGVNTELNRTRFTPATPAGSLTYSANPSYRQSQGLGGYADGGLITYEQVATLGEGNKPEVVLPLTNPRRTRELAAASGLMNILGGDGASITNVFIGNEQLDSRMFRVAKANTAANARMLNNTPRMI